MLDGGFSDLQILDSSRYRSLYIAKVYEVAPKKISKNSNLPLSGGNEEATFLFEKLKIDHSFSNQGYK